MIENNIFLIWLGSEPPEYINTAYKSLKNLNPNINIKKIYISTKRIEEISNIDIIDLNDDYEKLLKYAIIHQLKYPNDAFGFHEYNYKIKFITKICEFFRVYLINYFGGIYIDSDIWNIKSFEKILNENEVILCNRNNHHIDKGCIALRKNFFNDKILYEMPLYDIYASLRDNNNIKKYYVSVIDRFENYNQKIDFKKLSSLFFNNKISLADINEYNNKYQISDNQLFLHFNDWSWDYTDNSTNCRTDSCKFDNQINN